MTFFSTQFMHPTRSRQGSTVWATLATPKRPGKKQNAFVTMSGGQDSGLVSWVLFHTQHYYPCQLKSLHYQHLLQPDALYAQKHCSQLSFWFNWKSLYYSATRYYTSEKDAGDWRSKSSFRLASYYSYPFLFKGQSLTDQYETRATLFLRTIVKTQAPEDLSVSAEDSPVGYPGRLFVRSKKLSCWDLTRAEKKAVRGRKVYRGIKHGT